MAKSKISVYNGAINLPGGFRMDCQTMRIHEHQDKENVTAYPVVGGTATNYGLWLGTGTPMQDIVVSGYPFKGLGATVSNPFPGQMSVGLNAANTPDTGATATFQIDTGVTITGTYLVDDATMDHSRIVAGARTTLSMANTSDVVPTWV